MHSKPLTRGSLTQKREEEGLDMRYKLTATCDFYVDGSRIIHRVGCPNRIGGEYTFSLDTVLKFYYTIPI